MSPQHKSSSNIFLRYLLPVKGRMFILFMILLVSTGLQLIQPLLIQQFIDSAIALTSLRALAMIAGVYLAVAVGNQLISLGIQYLGNDVSWRVTNQLRGDLLKHCLGLDMRFLNQKTPGEMIERIDGDVTAMSNFFAMFVVQVVGSFVLLAGILIYMFTVHWPIALVMTFFTIIAIGSMVFIRNVGVKSSQEERAASAALFGFVEERVSGIEDVQANGGVPYVMHRFHRSMRDVFIKGRKAWVLRTVPWNMTVFLFTIAVTAVMLMGLRSYMDGGVTIGMLYLFFQYTQMLNDPIELLGNQMQEFQKAKSGMNRSKELLSRQSEIAEGAGEYLPEGALSLEFDQVSFGYSAEHLVLDRLKFELKPGERLGIVGRTGSGKSTITRLLLRMYNVDSGTIRVGGVDIQSLRLDALYRRVGMVTQEVQLFDGTLRDNLTLFNPVLTDAYILETTEQLGLKLWIDALPEGLDTPIQAGGTSLSAGEAQLFALTRVFLTKPSLLILDEPSSRLDAATEAIMQQAVDRLLEQCTAIIIAHRLATLEQADYILVLDHGKILEFGARAELANHPDSHYAALLRAGMEEALV